MRNINDDSAAAGAAPWLRVGNWALLACLGLNFGLAWVLPPWVGWENGPVENLQVLVLLGGGLLAACAARQQRGHVAAPLWWVAMFFWAIFLGRELAWGAVFLPPLGMDEWGPTISSSSLWWRPAIGWVLGAVLLLGCYWMLRYRVFGRVLLRLHRQHAWPWGSLAVFVLAMLLSDHADGSDFLSFETWYQTRVIVLEELSELCGYLALLLAQHALVRETGRWHERLH